MPLFGARCVTDLIALAIDDGKNWKEGDSVSGVRYKDFGGVARECKAHLTIVCDGMYSTLRKQFIEPEIRYPSYFVGLKIRNCKLPYPNCGHVVLGKPSPILVYPISSDVARVLVDVPGDKLPSKKEGGLQHYLRTTISPQIPEVLREAFLEVGCTSLDCLALELESVWCLPTAVSAIVVSMKKRKVKMEM